MGANPAGKGLPALPSPSNLVHRALDVAFGEDYSRGRTGNLAENLTALRHLALALLRRNGEGDLGPKRMRKNCAWDFKLLKRVFTGELNK